MRLQVIALAAALLSWAPPAPGDDRAATWLSVYASDDGLTVVSPRASAEVTLLDRLDFEAEIDVDVISAASIDLLTAASPRGYREVRHGFTFGATYRPLAEVAVAASYRPSAEPDYVSHGFGLSAEAQWLDERLTTAVGYRFVLDAVGRRGAERASWRALRTHDLSLGLGWVLGRRTVAQLMYEPQLHDGYQASPYRSVPIYLAGMAQPVGVPEAVPAERTRHALATGLRHALGGGWFGSAWLRLYADSWAVASHAHELELDRSWLASRLIAGLAVRAYGQSAASFHRHRYERTDRTVPRYRSADKLLASSWSLLLGPRLEASLGRVGPIDDLRGTLKVELYAQRFFDFAPLEDRRALVVSGGVAAEL